MHRLIFRPLLVFLTLVVLVVAFVQVSGRILFWLLDDVELAANQWLSAQQVRITGLEGRWRYLNPILRIERVDMPAGYLSGLYVEVDWLESIARNTPVARRISLEDGDFTLERTDAGWRPRGAVADIDIDFTNILYHSDEIDIRLALAFQAGDEIAPLNLSYRGVNRGGQHRHRVELGNVAAACGEACKLAVALDVNEAIWMVRPGSEVFKADADGFALPSTVSALGPLRLDSLTSRWRRTDLESGGELSLAFSELALSSVARASGGLSFVSRGRSDLYRGQLSGLYLQQAEERLELPPVWLSFDGALAEWWLEKLDLEGSLSFFARHLEAGTTASRWLNGLSPRGEALNVRGFVNWPGTELGYAATVRDLKLDGFAGAPALDAAGGELIGYEGGMQMQLNADNMDTHFPDLFRDSWPMDYVQGILHAWFSSEYFAMRGSSMRLGVNESRASGGFALIRPVGNPAEDRLTLMVNVDRSTVSGAKQFVPYRLPPGLPEWLEDGPRAGDLSDITLAYHGHLRTRPFEPSRRVELTTRIEEGWVRYHPDWPEVLNLHGTVAVAGREVRMTVDSGETDGGGIIDGSRIVLVDDAAYADVSLVAVTDVEAALGFVRRTPLAEWMTFITPDWNGQGDLTLIGSLHIPLKPKADHIGEVIYKDELAVDLDLGLDGVDLRLPEYRVELEALTGLMGYEYPNNVQATGVRGRMFGRPAIFGAQADTDTVVFHVAGQAAYEDVLTMLEIEDPGVMHGGFDFLADLHIELSEDEVSRLDVASDLTGLALDLPGEFSKLPEDSVVTDLSIRFLDDYQALSFTHRSATGWLHVDDAPIRGAIGFAATPPLFDSGTRELLLAGRVEGFSLDEVIPDGEAEMNLMLPVRLIQLDVGRFEIDELSFLNVTLDGTVAPDKLAMSFDGTTLKGSVAFTGDDPMEVHLNQLILPTGSDDEDPMGPEVIAELPLANVLIDQFTVGNEDYGSWSFKLIPDANGVAMKDLEAHVRGIAITSPKGVYWQAEPNESRFEGTLNMGDLAKVLPAWGYAAPLTTKSAEFSGALRWRGSPGNVDLDRLIGDATFQASDGRFLEVDASGQGAMRIFSLVNSSAWLKRLNFDFSDVTGEGISFESISTTARFDAGLLTFVDPVDIAGSGSNFRIGGQVNLIEGTLDNEMIVTLPVTRSLPWYAAYIAVASPITALGVLVGERVLRRPIEQFSSAKYHITGTIDEPELNFINVWDTSVDEPKTALDAAPASEADVNTAERDNQPSKET